MPQIVETPVYTLDELSDDAKDKARAWHRQVAVSDDWFQCVFEDFERICDLLGVRLKTDSVRLFGGGTRQEPRIYFRGFWSQGDGACFEGKFAFKSASARSIRSYAPQDAELRRIADALQAIQRRNFYQLHAEATHRGFYYHEYTMAISVERDSPANQAMTEDAESIVTEALRDLARWLYRQLEQEHEYQTSDEAVDEAITANGYTFTESGRRFG
jgi:hypothetical protein